LIAQFRALGYEVWTAEAREDPPGQFVLAEPTPIDLVRRIGAAGLAALDEEWVRGTLHPASFSVLKDFPAVARTVQDLYGEPLLGEEGSLTETRDYDTYVRSMGGAIEQKYADIRPFLLPGRILDEGCADGALLARIARDFPDSDLIGVDLSAEMLARAAERQRAGGFSGCFAFFRQANLMKPLALRSPVDTVICNSTLHEIWSFGGGAAAITHYLAMKRDQLRTGGRLVTRDVVGPDERRREVLLWCNPADGNAGPGPPPADPDREALREWLEGLSTRARFHRFAADFLPGRARPAFAWEAAALPGGEPAFRLSLQAAMEFITKMGYTDNWRPELEEEFCFWEFAEWREAFRAAGFHVLEGSRAYLNPWRVERSFQGRVALHDPAGNPLPFPVTNMVLIGEKR
jgi:SAM-dependent methyltransferase